MESDATFVGLEEASVGGLRHGGTNSPYMAAILATPSERSGTAELSRIPATLGAEGAR